MVTEATTGIFIGIVGEYKKSVARAFKLPEFTAGFEIGTEALLEAVQKKPLVYTPPSRYPSTERDICFQVDHETAYIQVVGSVVAHLAGEPLETIVTPVDIYQGSDATKKNITIRIHLTSHDKTLTSDEANDVLERVVAKVVAATQARVV